MSAQLEKRPHVLKHKHQMDEQLYNLGHLQEDHKKNHMLNPYRTSECLTSIAHYNPLPGSGNEWVERGQNDIR